MEQKRVDDYYIKILKEIVKKSVKVINYYHPKNQLETITENPDETRNALRSLENLRVLTLDPQLKFGLFNRGGYRVNLERATELSKQFK